MGYVDLHTWEPPMATAVSDRPVASALARIEIEIERGDQVTSLHHRQVEIDDPIAAAAIARLDGTRDLAAILKAVGRALPVGDLACKHIETALSGLAHHCLLEG